MACRMGGSGLGLSDLIARLSPSRKHLDPCGALWWLRASRISHEHLGESSNQENPSHEIKQTDGSEVS